MVENYVPVLEPTLFELYHENSKLDERLSWSFFQSIQAVRDNEPLLQEMTKGHKEYHLAPFVALAPYQPCTQKSIEEILSHRRSRRDFMAHVLPFQEFSNLFHLSYGLTGEMRSGSLLQPLRAAPSAGALYPLELYAIVQHVSSCEPGLYHFLIREQKLSRLKSGEFGELLSRWFFEAPFIPTASVLFLISGVFARTTVKYQDRGYRFILMEAGHLAQNLHLLAEAYGWGSVAVGGFLDREVEQFLGIDGVQESILYAVAVGTNA